MKKTSKKLITLGLIQLKFYSDQKKNLQNTLKLTENAAQKGAQIICLPELCQTLYFPQDPDAEKQHFAQEIPGPIIEAFRKISKKYEVVIILPVFEKDSSNNYYNSAVVIDTDSRLLDIYRKVHIPQDPYFYEKNYFEKGKGYKVYKTKLANFAVLICYDQWFPEAARIVALQGAEIIFYPTAIGNIAGYTSQDGNWQNAWETVMRGHSIANSVHIAAINRVGKERKLKFWGSSFVCDAFGKILKKASSKTSQIILCQIDLMQNEKIRDGWGFFENRRIDTYADIIKKF